MNKPNILFILTDQQGLDTLSAYGDTVCQTPHIDSLSKDGVTFDNAYTPLSTVHPYARILNHGALPAPAWAQLKRR